MEISGPWLALLGLAIGAFGTLIGAGGGFILIPILLLMYPTDEPEVITAISLAVIFFNATSGSIAYARKHRIDYRSALAFAAIAIPGSILGVWANHQVSRGTFEPIFGIGLILLALYLLWKKAGSVSNGHVGRPTTTRELIDSEGHIYRYSFNMRLGMGLSAAVGFVASFLGLGGGIIHVPAMVHLMSFPVHVATATSHLVLAIMSGAATVQHALAGSLEPGLSRLMWLAPGVILGAPLGARLSVRVKGSWILRFLALALLLVGLRLVWR
ncbi:MAG: sulfite exporter TauE/SafE family protein [Bdellovibrionales bacterium]|nr:sulfite exporter TauE/SafE family protein [Bdellovibrionales bacterium]